MNNDFENQLDEIRVKLNERTRDMKNADAAKAANVNAAEIARKYGITIVRGEPFVRPAARK
ncbi:MAG: hypothetical protein LBN99_00750 [Oscillospiraceae bacterium]|jgi:hypothetical protein|nr:hypothetical protein [Oscillospiraceae bacterium]